MKELLKRLVELMEEVDNMEKQFEGVNDEAVIMAEYVKVAIAEAIKPHIEF